MMRVIDKKEASVRFALSARVLHDSIDGEVIAIDLATGTYYSLRGSAAEVWGLVQRAPGATPEELAQALVVRYDAKGHNVEAAVTPFLDRLHEEGLIDIVEGVAATAVPSAVEPNGQPVEVFAAPVFEKHTDMQDLVLIDPVHDVSEAGWPHAPAEMRAGGSST